MILWYQDEKECVKHHHDKSKGVAPWRVYLMGRNKAIEYYRYKYLAPFRWMVIFNILQLNCRRKNIFDDYSSYHEGIEKARELIKSDADVSEMVDDAKRHCLKVV